MISASFVDFACVSVITIKFRLQFAVIIVCRDQRAVNPSLMRRLNRTHGHDLGQRFFSLIGIFSGSLP